MGPGLVINIEARVLSRILKMPDQNSNSDAENQMKCFKWKIAENMYCPSVPFFRATHVLIAAVSVSAGFN